MFDYYYASLFIIGIYHQRIRTYAHIWYHSINIASIDIHKSALPLDLHIILILNIQNYGNNTSSFYIHIDLRVQIASILFREAYKAVITHKNASTQVMECCTSHTRYWGLAGLVWSLLTSHTAGNILIKERGRLRQHIKK